MMAFIERQRLCWRIVMRKIITVEAHRILEDR